MGTLTINVGNLVVNGLTIGGRAVESSNNLKLFRPDAVPDQPSSDQDLATQIATEVARLMTGQQREVLQNSGIQADKTHRTTYPVCSKTQQLSPELQIVDGLPQPEKVTLRDCFDRVSERRAWAADTRRQHESIVQHWERWFASRDLAEPDVRDIQTGMFREFATWRGWDLSGRTAYKSVGYFETLLKSQMAYGAGCRDGLPAGDALLTQLPDHGLPPKGGTKAQRKQKRNETRAAGRWVPFTADDCSRLIDACSETDWPKCPSGLITSHEIWCAVWSLEWYFGITCEDCLMMSVAAIDFDTWDSGTIEYDRTKTLETGGPYSIPSHLRRLLRKIVDAANAAGRDLLFPFPVSIFRGGPNGDRKSTGQLYRRVEPMYEAAGLTPRVINGERRWFHSWRSAAVNQWRSIEPSKQEFFTAHSARTVSDKSYVVAEESVITPLVESYPVPDALRRMDESLQTA